MHRFWLNRTQTILLAAGAALGILAMLGQPGPGYMDAEYYTAGALNLRAGHFGWEPYLWNYLNTWASLPQPAFSYWMPLPALLAGLGMLLANSSSFWAARIVFGVLFAGLPLLVYQLARRTPWVRQAWLPAALALVPGMYAVYITLPETFLVYMYGGALFLGIAFLFPDQSYPTRGFWLRCVGLGLIAGGMHLTRADGLLWLAAAIGWIGLQVWQTKTSKLRIAVIGIGCVLCGYTLIMAPWLLRNRSVFGALMPPGGAQTIWMTNYNQTFLSDPAAISFSAWLAVPFGEHLRVWGDAIKSNLANLLVFQGGIVLFPLILVGIWRLRKATWVQFMVGLWFVTFGVMSCVFPFSGPRGGYIHSGSAFQVFAWLLVLPGLEGAALGLYKLRGLPVQRSMTVLGSFLVVCMAGISLWGYSTRVIGGDVTQPIWTAEERSLEAVGSRLAAYGADARTVVMVNNPPGLYYSTGYAAVVIPFDDLETVLQTARQFQVQYLIVDENQVNLEDVYMHPEDWPGLTYLETVAEKQIYQVIDEE